MLATASKKLATRVLSLPPPPPPKSLSSSLQHIFHLHPCKAAVWDGCKQFSSLSLVSKTNCKDEEMTTRTTTTTTTITALNTLRSFASSSSSSTSFSSSGDEKLGAPVKFLYLNNLHDNPGAVKKSRRIGRGIGCSKGKTSGRGQKGQKARSNVRLGFEGGQTPLYKRLPKRGMKQMKEEVIPMNLGTIQDYIDMGRLPTDSTPANPIMLPHLLAARMCKANTTRRRGGVKLLAKGKERLRNEIHVHFGWASKAAIAAVEDKGGSVVTSYFNDLQLRQIIKGDKWDHRPYYRQARPPPKYQPYYTSWNQRGYLHPALQLQGWFQKLDPQNGEELQQKFNAIRKQQQQQQQRDGNEEIEGKKMAAAESD